MKKTINSFRLIIFILISLAYISAYSQKYVKLTDLSGAKIPAQNLSDLVAAATTLSNALPTANQATFKVFDYGYYVYSSSMPEMINKTNQAMRTKAFESAETFVMFAREYDADCHLKKINPYVLLPQTGTLSCVQQYQTELNNQLDQILNLADPKFSDPFKLELQAIEHITWFVDVLQKCACTGGQNCFNSTFKALDAKLTGLQFSKKEITIGKANQWVSGTNDIYDFFGKEVIIKNKSYSIAEQVVDNKIQLEKPVKIIDEDDGSTLLESDGLKGKVYILDNESFTNGEWEQMQTAASSTEYIECWVILKDDHDKYYLFKQASFGPFQLGSGAARRTTSPMAAAIKVAGGAALDAFFQGLLNYVIKPEVKTLSDVVNSISWTGAIAEGLSCLIPWKEPEGWKIHLAQSAIKSSISAFAIVVEKAATQSDYKVAKGVEDFLIGCAAGTITGFIVGHPEIQKYGSELMKKGVDKIYRHLNSYPKLQKVIQKTWNSPSITSGQVVSNSATSNVSNLLEEAIADEVENELEQVATNQIISALVKKFWRTHEANVTNYLRNNFGAGNVGRQVYAKVHLKNGDIFNVIFDNLVLNGNKVQIIDAKSSITTNLLLEAINLFLAKFATKNQNKLYSAITNNSVAKIVPYGKRAGELWKTPGGAPNIPTNILSNLEKSVHFYVNDLFTNGYNIYKRIYNL